VAAKINDLGVLCLYRDEAIPEQAYWRPRGFQKFEATRFRDDRHKKVVRLSAVRTDLLYPLVNIPDIHFCLRLCQPHGHSAAGRIMPMKTFSYTIRNGNR